MQTYSIHDNYNKPFKVQICKNRVIIYKDNTPFYDQEVQHIFIGLSPLNPMTEYSGGHGPRFDGNSILLQEKDLTYIFIGESVYRFQAIAPIVSYRSPVGNNDVPYPYAVDAVGNYYLMIEHVIIKSPLIHTYPTIGYSDPYRYYYDAALITDDRGFQPPRTPLLGYIRNIRKFWERSSDAHDDEYNNYQPVRWTWRFKPNYKERASTLKNAYIGYEDGTKQELDSQTYISIMEEAGARLGVVRTINEEIIHKRIW